MQKDNHNPIVHVSNTASTSHLAQRTNTWPFLGKKETPRRGWEESGRTNRTQSDQGSDPRASIDQRMTVCNNCVIKINYIER